MSRKRKARPPIRTKGPSFIITGLPRSGTTWASVWLGSEGAVCLHDPIGCNFTMDQLLELDLGQRWGISDTVAWAFPGFLEKANCPVLLIDKDLELINTSLEKLGAPQIDQTTIENFKNITAPRCQSEDLFKPATAQHIWEWLRPETKFNQVRHFLLTAVKAGPKWEDIDPDPNVVKDLQNKIKEQNNVANGE